MRMTLWNLGYKTMLILSINGFRCFKIFHALKKILVFNVINFLVPKHLLGKSPAKSFFSGILWILASTSKIKNPVQATIFFDIWKRVYITLRKIENNWLSQNQFYDYCKKFPEKSESPYWWLFAKNKLSSFSKQSRWQVKRSQCNKLSAFLKTASIV